MTTKLRDMNGLGDSRTDAATTAAMLKNATQDISEAVPMNILRRRFLLPQQQPADAFPPSPPPQQPAWMERNFTAPQPDPVPAGGLILGVPPLALGLGAAGIALAAFFLLHKRGSL